MSKQNIFKSYTMPVFGLVVMVLFVAFIQSCSASTSSSKNSGLKVIDGKPVLTIYNQSAARLPANAESDIDKKIEEITGYKLERTFLIADQATTSGIMLASGDYADLINMREDTQKFIDAGVYIPLQDLIKEHAPNIYRLYKPYWEQIKNADGNIYTIPDIYPMNVRRTGLASSGSGIGMHVQIAVLKWAGYPKIQTTAQYFDLLKRYRDEFPEIDGAKTIGFAFPAEGWRFDYTVYAAPALNGYPNEAGPLIDCIVAGNIDYESDPCPGEWVPRDPFYQGVEFRNTMEQFNQAYLAGLIPKETVVQTHEQYNEKIASGRVLGVFDQTWEIGGALEVLKKEKPDRLLINFPITAREDQKVYTGIGSPNYGAGWGISVKAVDPVAAIKYLDATLSDEVIKLLNWGIEGEDYLVNADGYFYRTPEMRVRIKDKTYNEKHWGNAILTTWIVQGMFDDGNAVDPGTQPDEFFAELGPTEKEVASAYGVKSLGELFPEPQSRRVSFSPLWSFSFTKEDDADYLKVSAERGKLLKEYVTALIFADAGKFASIWQDFNTKMAAIPQAELWLNTWKAKLKMRIDSWQQ